MILVCLITREDRETELLLKLDNFELRDHPNRRIVSHIKKLIGITKKRIMVAKSRCNELKGEYNGLVRENKKVKEKTNNGKEDDSISDGYLKGLDEDEDEDEDNDDDDDDVLELKNVCNVELDFDGCSSSTSRVSSIDRNESETSTDMNTDVNSVN